MQSSKMLFAPELTTFSPPKSTPVIVLPPPVIVTCVPLTLTPDCPEAQVATGVLATRGPTPVPSWWTKTSSYQMPVLTGALEVVQTHVLPVSAATSLVCGEVSVNTPAAQRIAYCVASACGSVGVTVIWLPTYSAAAAAMVSSVVPATTSWIVKLPAPACTASDAVIVIGVPAVTPVPDGETLMIVGGVVSMLSVLPVIFRTSGPFCAETTPVTLSAMRNCVIVRIVVEAPFAGSCAASAAS